MAEVNTSSYPTAAPVQPFNFMDSAQKAVNLGRSQVAYDKDKFDLAQQRLGAVAKQYTALLDKPDLNENDVVGTIQNFVKLKMVPAEMAGTMISQIPADGDLRKWLEGQVTHAQTMQQALDWHVGQQNTMDTGQGTQPIAVSQKPSFGGIRSTGLPIQKQVGPSTQTFDTNEFMPDGKTPNPNHGKPVLQGPQTPQAAPGSVAMPPPVNGFTPPPNATSPLPVQQPQQQLQPQAQNTQRPTGPATGMGPTFDTGRDQFVEDQKLATQKLTAVKPALLALDLAKDLRSGPGTDTWNKGVAFLKANGFIPIGKENDPTAVYQEANKYYNQYINKRGNRSDADLANQEMSSPNVGTQISPALIKLTRTAIAQDRIEAARANAFTSNDYSKYGQHRTTFPSRMDERAFYVDTLDQGEKQKLLAEMLKKSKSKSGNDVKEATRFFNSLETAKHTGVFGQQ